MSLPQSALSNALQLQFLLCSHCLHTRATLECPRQHLQDIPPFTVTCKAPTPPSEHPSWNATNPQPEKSCARPCDVPDPSILTGRALQRQHIRKAASLSHTQGYSGEIEGYHCLLGETTWERSSHQVCRRIVWQYLAQSTRCKTQACHLLCASHHPPQPQQTAFLYSETPTGQHPQKEHQHDLSTVPPPTARLSSARCCHQTSKAMLWPFEQLSHLSQKIRCHCFFLCITHSHWHSRRLGFPSCAKDLVWPLSLVFQDSHICLAVTHMWVCHSWVCQPPWLSSKLWSQRNLGRKTLVYPAEGTRKTFWSYLLNFNNFLSITESPLRQMTTRQSPTYPAAPTCDNHAEQELLRMENMGHEASLVKERRQSNTLFFVRVTGLLLRTLSGCRCNWLSHGPSVQQYSPSLLRWQPAGSRLGSTDSSSKMVDFMR